eukprot:476823_1
MNDEHYIDTGILLPISETAHVKLFYNDNILQMYLNGFKCFYLNIDQYQFSTAMVGQYANIYAGYAPNGRRTALASISQLMVMKYDLYSNADAILNKGDSLIASDGSHKAVLDQYCNFMLIRTDTNNVMYESNTTGFDCKSLAIDHSLGTIGLRSSADESHYLWTSTLQKQKMLEITETIDVSVDNVVGYVRIPSSYVISFQLKLNSHVGAWGCADTTNTRIIPGLENKVYACPGTIVKGGPRGDDAAKLCSLSFGVCESAATASALGITADICNNNIAQTTTEFFATKQSSNGNWICAISGINDVWGCALNTFTPNTGILTSKPCNELTKGLGDGDWNNWVLPPGSITNESVSYTLTDSSSGGVLCCNQPSSILSIYNDKDNSTSDAIPSISVWQKKILRIEMLGVAYPITNYSLSLDKEYNITITVTQTSINVLLDNQNVLFESIGSHEIGETFTVYAGDTTYDPADATISNLLISPISGTRAFSANKSPTELDLRIHTNGFLNIIDANTQKLKWRRRTICENNLAKYLYEMADNDYLANDGTDALFDVTCTWYLICDESIPLVKSFDYELFEIKLEKSSDGEYPDGASICSILTEGLKDEAYQKSVIIDSSTGSIFVTKRNVQSNIIEKVSFLIGATNASYPFDQTQQDILVEYMKDDVDLLYYNMRCWSRKYRHIDTSRPYISSFVVKSECGFQGYTCDSTYDIYDENVYSLLYTIPKFKVCSNETNSAEAPYNSGCILLQTCKATPTDVYDQMYGFSKVFISGGICNHTNKDYIETDIEYNSTNINTLYNNYLMFTLIRPHHFYDDINLYVVLSQSEQSYFSAFANTSNIVTNTNNNLKQFSKQFNASNFTNSSIVISDFIFHITNDYVYLYNGIDQEISSPDPLISRYIGNMINDLQRNYSFFIEWDHLRDYLRFGFGHNLNYVDNEIIIDIGYHINGGPKAFINTALFSSSLNIYNTTNETGLNIQNYNFYYNYFDYSFDYTFFDLLLANSTNPKPCYGHDKQYVSYTRITKYNEDVWEDDCSTYLWRAFGTNSFSLHPVYLNYFNNNYKCFHGKFTQSSWERSFKIDDDIDFDYIVISVDILTFCGFSAENGDIVEIYVDDVMYWSGSNVKASNSDYCQRYFTKNWIQFNTNNSNITYDDILDGCIDADDLNQYACSLPVEFILQPFEINTNPIFVLKFVYYSIAASSDAQYGFANLKIKTGSCTQSRSVYGVAKSESCSIFPNTIASNFCVINNDNIKSIDMDSYIVLDFKAYDIADDTVINFALFDHYDNDTLASSNYFNFYISNQNCTIINSYLNIFENCLSMLNLTQNGTNFYTNFLSNSKWSSLWIDWSNTLSLYSLLPLNTEPNSGNFLRYSDSIHIDSLSINETYVSSEQQAVVFAASGFLDSCSSENGTWNIFNIIRSITDPNPSLLTVNIHKKTATSIPVLQILFEYQPCLNISLDVYQSGQSLPLQLLFIRTSTGIRVIHDVDGAGGSADFDNYNCSISNDYSDILNYIYVSDNVTVFNGETLPSISQCGDWIMKEIDISPYYVFYHEDEQEGSTNEFCSEYHNFVQTAKNMLIKFKVQIPSNIPDESKLISLVNPNTQHAIFTISVTTAKRLKFLYIYDTAQHSKTYVTQRPIQSNLLTPVEIIITQNYINIIVNGMSQTIDQSAPVNGFEYGKLALVCLLPGTQNPTVKIQNIEISNISLPDLIYFGYGDKIGSNIIGHSAFYSSNGDHNYVDINAIGINIATDWQIRQYSDRKLCLSDSKHIPLSNGEEKVFYDDCNAFTWYAAVKPTIGNSSDFNHNITPFYDEIGRSIDSSSCFHGPLNSNVDTNRRIKQSLNRYFSINDEYEYIKLSIKYYGLCTWNPNNPEHDHGSLSIVNQNNNVLHLWESAFQYEEVMRDCQGYEKYPDWERFTSRLTLNDTWIECLGSILDLICSQNIVTFFYENQLYEPFLLSVYGQFNQLITNEAWGFSDIRIEHNTCPPLLYPGHSTNMETFYGFTSTAQGDCTKIFEKGESIISDNKNYMLSYQSNNNIVFYKLYPDMHPMWQTSNATKFLSLLNEASKQVCATNTGSVTIEYTDGRPFGWSRSTLCESSQSKHLYHMLNNEFLSAAESLFDLNCDYHLTLMADANLMLLKSNDSTPIWQSASGNNKYIGHQKMFQIKDGAMQISVQIGSKNKIIWHTTMIQNSGNEETTLILTVSGELLLISLDSMSILWCQPNALCDSTKHVVLEDDYNQICTSDEFAFIDKENNWIATQLDGTTVEFSLCGVLDVTYDSFDLSTDKTMEYTLQKFDESRLLRGLRFSFRFHVESSTLGVDNTVSLKFNAATNIKLKSINNTFLEFTLSAEHNELYINEQFGGSIDCGLTAWDYQWNLPQIWWVNWNRYSDFIRFGCGAMFDENTIINLNYTKHFNPNYDIQNVIFSYNESDSPYTRIDGIEFSVFDYPEPLLCYSSRSSPTYYPGLFFWYDGQSYNINNQTWYDKSSNKRDLTSQNGQIVNPTGIKKNQNSKNDTYIDVDPMSKILFPEMKVTNNQYTLIFVSKLNISMTNASLFMSINKENNLTSYYGFYNDKSGVAIHNGEFVTENKNCYSNFFVGVDRYNSFYTNGLSRTIPNSYWENSINSLPLIASSTTNYSIAEVMLFDHMMDDSQIENIVSYLKKKYINLIDVSIVDDDEWIGGGGTNITTTATMTTTATITTTTTITTTAAMTTTDDTTNVTSQFGNEYTQNEFFAIGAGDNVNPCCFQIGCERPNQYCCACSGTTCYTCQHGTNCDSSKPACYIDLTQNGFHFCHQACNQWCWAAVTTSFISYYNQVPITNCNLAQCQIVQDFEPNCCTIGCNDACNKPIQEDAFIAYLNNKGIPVAKYPILTENQFLQVLFQRIPIILALFPTTQGHVSVVVGASQIFEPDGSTHIIFKVFDPWIFDFVEVTYQKMISVGYSFSIFQQSVSFDFIAGIINDSNITTTTDTKPTEVEDSDTVSGKDNGIPSSVFIGVVIGIIVVFLLIIGVIYWFYIRSGPSTPSNVGAEMELTNVTKAEFEPLQTDLKTTNSPKLDSDTD